LGLLKGQLIKKWVLAAERWLLLRFDRISTISERMVERLFAKTDGRSTVVLFPNWVDLNYNHRTSKFGTFVPSPAGEG